MLRLLYKPYLQRSYLIFFNTGPKSTFLYSAKAVKRSSLFQTEITGICSLASFKLQHYVHKVYFILSPLSCLFDITLKEV